MRFFFQRGCHTYVDWEGLLKQDFLLRGGEIVGHFSSKNMNLWRVESADQLDEWRIDISCF